MNAGVDDPLRELDVRLTYRTMRVIQVIAAQEMLSNIEVGRRAGILDEGQISRLLARLAIQRLVQNTGVRRGRNSWRLTPTGWKLEAAISRELIRDRSPRVRPGE
jgi:hypothetical protein